MIVNVFPALVCAALAAATLQVRTGLLDRLVQHYKENFLEDLVDVAPIQINVSIQQAPPGYVDSAEWDYDSAVRLIGLIRENSDKLSKPVKVALREFLAPVPVPSRRYGGFGMLHQARKMAAHMRKCMGDPKKPGYPKNCPRRRQGLRRFPARSNKRNGRKASGRKFSINRLYVPSFPNPNDLYYDEMIPFEQPTETSDLMMDGPPRPFNATLQDDNVVVISNPVEARLPSGHISIGQLRRILEARAEAARVMPTRPTTTMIIAALNKTGTEAGEGGENSTDSTGATDDGTGGTGDTGGTGATGGDGTGEGGEATTAGEGEAAAEGGGE